MGKDIDINLYKVRRSSPRWEGTKGFLWGALPAGILGALAGAAVGLVAIGLATAVAPTSFLAFGTIGMAGLVEVPLLVGLATGIFSGSVAGYNNAMRESRTAIELNHDLDSLIQKKVAQAQGVSMAPAVAKDEAPSQGTSTFVQKLKNPVSAISSALGDNVPGAHVQQYLESKMGDMNSEKHR